MLRAEIKHIFVCASYKIDYLYEWSFVFDARISAAQRIDSEKRKMPTRSEQTGGSSDEYSSWV